MSEVTRPGVETLKLLDCPCCGGSVDVFECGYSSFNPGSARCQGECRRVWELGYVDSEWDCGERWNEKAAEIAKGLRAFSLIRVDKKLTVSRDFSAEALHEKADRLLKKLEQSIIGAKPSANTQEGE